MKVRLTKPLRQSGRVIPAGVILSDAPVSLMQKLISEGHAELVCAKVAKTASPASDIEDRGKPVQPPESPSAGVATASNAKPVRKKVKRNG